MSSSSGEKTQPKDVATAVLEIVGEMSPSGPTEVRADMQLVAELGFDSLGLVELLVAVEDALELRPVELEALATMDRVADLQRIAQEASASSTPE